MVGVIITFRSEGGLDRSAVMGIAEKAAPTFEGMPGLRSKVFTFDRSRVRRPTSMSGSPRTRPGRSSRRSWPSG
jgi:hypothetical protein